MPHTFAIGESDFLLDGAPHRILSGALHYFRVHPGHWSDRIRKARLLGLNTIETYVAWNVHEPVRGEWDATGERDLGAFLDLVAAEGMHAIVRPGPYICAEWTNGGLPAWLTAIEGIGLRRSEPQYLAEVSAYLRRVYEIVAPRQIDRGGNVILVQIENEYGAYGDDAAYLTELVRLTRECGITVPLTTIDQPQPYMLANGSLPELHKTGSFGSRATQRLATLREHQPTGPLMCAEFWNGWFDWWGGVHHTTSAAESAAELEELLAAGASVNLYMLHGGTNFALTSGANHKGRYLPITTSYDYSAPLDEAGRPTAKFEAFREVIARYAEVPAQPVEVPGPAPVLEAELAALGDWLPAADPASTTPHPSTFEELAFPGAIVRYDAELPGSGGEAGVPDGAASAPTTRTLAAAEVRDRAWIEVDGTRVGTLDRTAGERSLPVPGGEHVTVIVEELGRVNYGERLGEPKGLIGPVLLDGEPLTGWSATPVDLAAAVAWAESAPAGSVAGHRAGRTAMRGTFTLEEASDLFLDTAAWGTGYAIVNGFLLGRYWSNGPQRTLYVPGPVTRPGENTIVVLELTDAPAAVARFVADASLGPTEE